MLHVRITVRQLHLLQHPTSGPTTAVTRLEMAVKNGRIWGGVVC